LIYNAMCRRISSDRPLSSAPQNAKRTPLRAWAPKHVLVGSPNFVRFVQGAAATGDGLAAVVRRESVPAANDTVRADPAPRNWMVPITEPSP
jgi:hypothetical protein